MKGWKLVETAIFIGLFFYVTYDLVSGFSQYSWETVSGKGFVSDFFDPISQKKEYYKSILAVIGIFIPIFTIWEIFVFLFSQFRNKEYPQAGWGKISAILRRTSLEYQPTFLASTLGGLIPKILMIDVFWHWLPWFQKYSFFTITFTWYNWIYALLAWELTTWLWHFGAHRIRIFWCLHSPHHAPQEFNMTVAWVHFFAEGYYTTVLQLFILMILGINPAMLVVIMSFEVMWGTLIHAGERSLKTGRLGITRFFVMTPSHHRVHHGRNPLYLDTNFCTLLPFWDWVFGTLQPLRDEVKLEYGITRKVVVTNFWDFYFGEIFLLAHDLKRAHGVKNKLLYVIMPPGWSADGPDHTAAKSRKDFLATHPGLSLAKKRTQFTNFFVTLARKVAH